LHAEGILRISGSNAVVQFYKDQFDRGMQVLLNINEKNKNKNKQTNKQKKKKKKKKKKTVLTNQ
jgi:hypothetical protein